MEPEGELPAVEEPEMELEPEPEMDEAMLDQFLGDEPELPAVEPEPLATPESIPATPAPPTPAPAPKRSGDGEAGLLDYLSNLTQSLSEEKRSEFLNSEARLKLEYLKSRLRGEPGLKRDVERFAPSVPSPSDVPLTPKRLTDTLTYISKMSGFHPDAGIGIALRSRVAVVLDRIRQLKEGSL